MNMSDIGDRLREERERLLLTQEAFGAAGGVRKNAQSDYERNLRVPDCRYLAALAQHGLDVLYVITGQRGNTTTGFLPEEFELLESYRRIGDEQIRKSVRLVCAGLGSAKDSA